jgi:glutaredoxin 2
MNKYTFKEIGNILITGGCQGEIKSFFDALKTHIFIKKEDEDEIHPMEEKRLKRKMDIGMPRNARPFDRFEPASASHFFKVSKMKSTHSVYSNSIIFVTGDCGFGSNKETYYADLLTKMNRILSYNNIYVVFVRGNHDDPQYFDGEKINLSNIKAVPDYSIVEVKDKVILCVGGAISADRLWRKKQEERINLFKTDDKKTLYWDNEAPILDKSKLDEVIEGCDKIDFVVSHTAPSFADPIELGNIKKWEDKDEKLNEDIINERLVMDKIFEYLRDNKRRPLYWVYGHFNYNSLNKRSNTWFKSLISGFNPINVEFEVKMNSIELSATAQKPKTSKKILNDHWFEDAIAARAPRAVEEVPEREQEAPFGEEVPEREQEFIEMPIQEEAHGDDPAYYNEPLNALDANVAEGNIQNDGIYTIQMNEFNRAGVGVYE